MSEEYKPSYPKDAKEAIEMLQMWLDEDADENTEYLKGYRMALRLGIMALKRTSQPDKELLLPVISHHCNTTHSACDCVLVRIKTLIEQNKELATQHERLEKQLMKDVSDLQEVNKELVDALEAILKEITSCGDVNEEGSGDEAIYKVVTDALDKYKEKK